MKLNNSAHNQTSKHLELANNPIDGFLGLKFFTTTSEAKSNLKQMNVDFEQISASEVEFYFVDASDNCARTVLSFSNDKMISATTYYQSISENQTISIFDKVNQTISSMYGMPVIIDQVNMWKSDLNKSTGSIISLLVENNSPILIFMLFNKQTNKTINTD